MITQPSLSHSRPTTERANQIAVFSQRVAIIRAVPTLPKLLGSDSERGAETDATRDITVIGS